MGSSIIVPRNRLMYPGRAPRLNIYHPAMHNNGMRLACVAQPGGVMRDLLTGYIGACSGVSGQSNFEQNSLGWSCWPSGTTSGSYIPFPALISGESIPQWTMAAIVKPITNNIGQGFIGDNGAGPYYKIQTANTNAIGFSAAGVGQWSIPCISGNDYFAAVCINRSLPNPNSHSVAVNLTTGQIWQFTSNIGATTPNAGANYNVLTYSSTGGSNNTRVACAMLSAKPLTAQQLLDWAHDPWDLWYAPSFVPYISSISGSIGVFSLIEPPDLIVNSGNLDSSGIFSLLENSDIIINSGNLDSSGILSLLDSSDTINITGTTSFLPIVGAFNLNEDPDLINAEGFLNLFGILFFVEPQDIISDIGFIGYVGTFTIVENPDTIIYSVRNGWSGTLSIQENPDIISDIGKISIVGTFSFVETLDSYDIESGTSIFGAMSFLETPDNIIDFGKITNVGTSPILEIPDRIVFIGPEPANAGTFNIFEEADTYEFTGNVRDSPRFRKAGIESGTRIGSRQVRTD
jgi:hypothetical protein